MNARAAQFYKTTSANSGVASATPHKLTSLLFEKARRCIGTAIASIENGELLNKINAITRAQDILAQLDATLDHTNGGEVSASLAQLYEYCMRRLVTANRTNDVGILREVDSIVEKIESSWNAIGDAR